MGEDDKSREVSDGALIDSTFEILYRLLASVSPVVMFLTPEFRNNTSIS